MLPNSKIYTKALFVLTCKGRLLIIGSIRLSRQMRTIDFIRSFLCDCAINKQTREQVRVANIAYQKITNTLIDSGIYDTNDDFTIVRQPFMENMRVPTTVTKCLCFVRYIQSTLVFSYLVGRSI
jgi:hypothetical protein